MNAQHRSRIFIGLILIILGAWFLARQFFPDLQIWSQMNLTWPLLLVGLGIFLFIFGLLSQTPGMAVPAAIVTGIGGLLYWQNETGNWSSWAYAWALVPGYVGVGSILAGLLGENPRKSILDGINLILISLVLFTIFSTLLGGPVTLGLYWPLLLILFGLWILIRTLLRRYI